MSKIIRLALQIENTPNGAAGQLVVLNDGTLPVNITNVSSSNANFIVTGPKAFTVPVGGSVGVSCYYTADAAGNSVTLTVTSDAASGENIAFYPFGGDGSYKGTLNFLPALPATVSYDGTDATVVFDSASYKTGVAYYVDLSTGNDSNAGTQLSPFKTVREAVTVAVASSNTEEVVYVSDGLYDNTQSPGAFTIPAGKRISIVATGTAAILASADSSLHTWTADGTGIWKTTRSQAYSMFNLGVVDAHGLPTPMPTAADEADCKATPGTWFTDGWTSLGGTTVWVNTGGSAPTKSTHFLGVNFVVCAATLGDGAKLYFENLIFLSGRHGTGSVAITGASPYTATFAMKGCKLAGGHLRRRDPATASGQTSIAGDLLTLVNVKTSATVDCVLAYSGRDGHNAHFTGIPSADRRACLVFSAGDVSYNHGLYEEVVNSNNAFTSHEGASVFRVNCVGKNTRGPVLADVNGCYSVTVCCDMQDSQAGAGNAQSAYYFDDVSATDPGVAVLIGCTSSGAGHDLSGSSSFPVYADAVPGADVVAVTVNDIVPVLTPATTTIAVESAGGYSYTPEDVANKATATDLGGATPSDTKYPSQKAVKTYADRLIPNANALVYKGAIDCAANPNYPAADAGFVYVVSAAGKIGGASGIDVSVGDMAICNTDGTASGDQATVGTKWNLFERNLVGAVTGPTSSTDNAVCRYDGTTGKVVQNSNATMDDGGNLSLSGNLKVGGVIQGSAQSTVVTMVPWLGSTSATGSTGLVGLKFGGSGSNVRTGGVNVYGLTMAMYNQASGTASNFDHFVDRSGTVGSGAQYSQGWGNTGDGVTPHSTMGTTGVLTLGVGVNKVVNQRTSNGLLVWEGTQAQYDALTPDSGTLYFIVG